MGVHYMIKHFVINIIALRLYIQKLCKRKLTTAVVKSFSDFLSPNGFVRTVIVKFYSIQISFFLY